MCLVGCWFVVFVFFFKQKTAYEMRISDWSSDVCSSDLPVREPHLDLLRRRVVFAVPAVVWGKGRLAHPTFRHARRHRLFRFAVPFRIAEVLVRLHEVPDREEVLAVVSSRSAPDDLLELDHRPDWPHQDRKSTRLNP